MDGPGIAEMCVRFSYSGALLSLRSEGGELALVIVCIPLDTTVRNFRPAAFVNNSWLSAVVKYLV